MVDLDCKPSEAALIMKEIVKYARANFSAQPIICSKTQNMKGIELLSRRRLDFSNPLTMLKLDVEAIKTASLLAAFYKGNIRIHCNVELSSIEHLQWGYTMAGYIHDGVVVELVERNEGLMNARRFDSLCRTVEWVRRMGGAVAMDDWTGTPIEMEMIKHIKPEIVKVNEHDLLQQITSATLAPGAEIVVEKIETSQQALEAQKIGATELQGYWCDVLKEHEVPPGLTPPGVVARDLELLQFHGLLSCTS